MTRRRCISGAVIAAVWLATLIAPRLGEAWRVHVSITERLREQRTLMHADDIVMALDRLALATGQSCHPVANGSEVRLGSACDKPNRLILQLVADGFLSEPVVCDAWGHPMLIRGLSDVDVKCNGVVNPGCAPLGTWRVRYGLEWSQWFEIISLGSDGVRTVIEPQCGLRWMADTREDRVVGPRGEQALGPGIAEPSRVWQFYWHHGSWFDRSGVKLVRLPGLAQ